MTQAMSKADRVALTDLIRSMRPDWERWLIEAVLQSHPGAVLPDAAVAALRWAADPAHSTPKGIFWSGRHWQGLDSAPDRIDTGPRCTVCGKPEGRCLTERPGPDDHEFEPTR